MKGGLTRRTVIASGLLAVIIGAAFGVLVLSIVDLNRVEQRSRRSDQVLVVANSFERLIVDAETGVRGFVITTSEDFLEPWQAAQTDFPDQARMLEQLVADNPEQLARAQQIAAAGRSYLMDYTVPLVDTAQRDPAAARTVAVTAEGKRRLDAIRAEFDRFITTEQHLAVARQSRADTDAERAIAAAAAGLAGSILLIGLYTGYLSRAIVRPVRQVAAMAGRLADGDLGTRLPERGVGEIGVLERSFNTMAGSLQESRNELAASRARIVAASDQARRQIERDLHDGTQQRLVSLALDVRAAEAAVPLEMTELRAVLTHITSELGDATDELRELSRGIHPAILSEGGLPPALKALARRSVIPVELEVDVPARLPEHIEVAAYYVVSEALTNAAKHAHASVAHVNVRAHAGNLQLSVRDDGAGGATPGRAPDSLG